MILNLIIIIAVSYLLGTFPSAYLIVKFFKNKNIFECGSGNAGAMNSFEITNSKRIGLYVFALDALKGFIAVYISQMFMLTDMLAAGLASIVCILGHNYNPFFKFKGGRGLSTAFGALAAINFFGILFWVLMWITAYFILRRHIHFANIFASVMAPVLVFFAPDRAVMALVSGDFWLAWQYKYLFYTICFLVLIKHLKIISEFIKSKTKSQKR